MEGTLGGTIISWCSQTQETVTLSSTEAEYVALSTTCKDVVYTQNLLREILYIKVPGIVLEDNTGAIYLVRNKQVGNRTKHIEIRHHWIRSLEDSGQAKIMFVKSAENAADIHTKNVDAETLRKHRERIRSGLTYSRLNWKQIIMEADDKGGST